MLPDRLRHSPVLVLFPPVFLLVTGIASVVLSGVEVMPDALWFGVLSICTAILLGTVSGPNAIIIFYLALGYALFTLLPTVLEVGFGIGDGVSLWLGLALICAIGYAVARLRSPFRHRFTGEVFIDRPRALVWDALYLQPTDNHWKPHVRKVEAVPERPDHFIQYYQSGIDQADDLASPPMMNLRSNVTTGSSFTLESVEMPGQKMLNGTTDRQTYVLEDCDSGTRVTTVEILEKAQIHLLVLSALIRPCQDELRQLKMILEGSNDTTFASAFYQGDEREEN